MCQLQVSFERRLNMQALSIILKHLFFSCTGPLDIVKFGGCITCQLAINRTHLNDSVHCLPQSVNNCPDGYYQQFFKADINHTLDRKPVSSDIAFKEPNCNLSNKVACKEIYLAKKKVLFDRLQKLDMFRWLHGLETCCWRLLSCMSCFGATEQGNFSNI